MNLIKNLYLSVVIFSLLFFISFSCSNPSVSTNKKIEKPNILFILADDLGYSDLSCMGSTYYETPNIDKIASRGTIFTNGYAACQVCSPSRASIMTGKSPARHHITDWIGAKVGEDWRKAGRHNKLLPPEYVRHLPFEDKTMAEAFKEGGYNTFFAGKWHLGNEGSYPEDHGFDINQGGYERGGPYSGGFFSPFNNPKMDDHPDEKGMSLSVKLGNETAKFIEAKRDEPFFAMLSFYAVHAPIQTTKEKWSRYRDKAEQQGLADHGFEMERRMPIRQHQDNPVYAGLIEQMDEGVGVVLDKLEELGIADNTIVVFTSDNGGVASGDNFSTANTPLRGGKGYQWEGGLRIPYLVYVPWMEQQIANSDEPVNGTDFYPSLLDLAGLQSLPEQHQDGVSFAEVLSGNQLADRSIVWHYPHYGNQGGDPSAVIRKGNYKLIHYYEDNSVELYNLKSDLNERNNLAEQEKKLVQRLKQELDDYLVSVNANMPLPDPIFHPDSAAKVKLRYSTKVLERVEKIRSDMLNPEWQPNEDWWGSQVTID